jgi:hypothetical protein
MYCALLVVIHHEYTGSSTVTVALAVVQCLQKRRGFGGPNMMKLLDISRDAPPTHEQNKHRIGSKEAACFCCNLQDSELLRFRLEKLVSVCRVASPHLTQRPRREGKSKGFEGCLSSNRSPENARFVGIRTEFVDPCAFLLRNIIQDANTWHFALWFSLVGLFYPFGAGIFVLQLGPAELIVAKSCFDKGQ